MEGMYILKGKKAVPCLDARRWGKWIENVNKVVARKTIGNCNISTVFLGLDHSYEAGKLLLFETLVFGGPLSDEMERYTTCDEAVIGHKAMVKRVK